MADDEKAQSEAKPLDGTKTTPARVPTEAREAFIPPAPADPAEMVKDMLARLGANTLNATAAVNREDPAEVAKRTRYILPDDVEIQEYDVIRTKIRDSRGRYVKPGQKAQLTYEDAVHYNNLGLLKLEVTSVKRRAKQ